MEDSAREAASLSFTALQLSEIAEEIQKISGTTSVRDCWRGTLVNQRSGLTSPVMQGRREEEREVFTMFVISA